MTDIRLDNNDLTSWDFSGQNLSNAYLGWSTLTNANLSVANLSNAELSYSTLTNSDLSGANLKNANINAGLHSAVFDSVTTYNQGTFFPLDFDPVAAGLSFMKSPIGDVDASDVLDVVDIDMLAARIRGGRPQWWLPEAMFDVNTDSGVNNEVLLFWVHDLKHTWLGNANLNGEFDSHDLIDVLAAGKYEVVSTYEEECDCFPPTANWATGDFNADALFNSDDLIDALADGGYEMGLRPMTSCHSGQIRFLVSGVRLGTQGSDLTPRTPLTLPALKRVELQESHKMRLLVPCTSRQELHAQHPRRGQRVIKEDHRVPAGTKKRI